jgi:hypothetical protein
MKRHTRQYQTGIRGLAALALSTGACSGHPSAPTDQMYLLRIDAPALTLSGAGVYEVKLLLWFDGLGSYESANIDVEPGTTGTLEFRSPRLAPERFDSLRIAFRGYECSALQHGHHLVLRELPPGRQPTVEIDIPRADTGQLVTGITWCGVALDDLFGHDSRFYLGLKFDSVDPEGLRGTFATGYQVSRRGEEGPFTGHVTSTGFELTLQNIDGTTTCNGSVFRLYGTLAANARIASVRITSENPNCPVPGSSVRLYRAPDYWGDI